MLKIVAADSQCDQKVTWDLFAFVTTILDSGHLRSSAHLVQQI